jgi:phage tail sheath gpL-like
MTGTITTSVPADFVAPQTFHIFNFLRAGNALRNIPLVVALVGAKTSAGTGTAGAVYDVNDSAQTDAVAGVKGELALMARQAMFCTRLFRRGPKIVMVPLAEPGGGTANVQTIANVGSATTDGNQIITIAGRKFVIGVHNGDSVSTIALAQVAEFKKRDAELPVVITVAAGVVTLTHPTKGENGGDVKVTVDQQVTGCVATVATTAVGAGVTDITTALSALSPKRYDGIAIANRKAADVANILLDIVVRWAPESKTWGFYFMFDPSTIGTATAVAAAANHMSVLVGNFEGCPNAPGEGAASMAVLAFSRARPNSSFDDAVVPLAPPADALWYTAPERNTAIKAGLTVFTGITDSSGNVVENRARVVQMVTSKTTIGALPDDRVRDLGVPRTAVELATQLDAAVAELRENNPDGVSNREAKQLYKLLAAGIWRAEARARPPVLNPDFVERDIEAMLLENDETVLGRINGRMPSTPDLINHQAAFYHDILIGA